METPPPMPQPPEPHPPEPEESESTPAAASTTAPTTPEPTSEPPEETAFATESAEVLHRLLRLMQKHDASDLHLKVGSPPLLRIAGRVQTIRLPAHVPGDIPGLLWPILSAEQIERFDGGSDLDTAYSVDGVGRFRLSIFRQRGSVSAAIRRVRTEIPGFGPLHLPAGVLRRVASYPRGLVLVCGVTGSGKSTTLAAMLGHINRTRRCHILTIEDPIEFLYTDDKAFVNQREVGIDVASFHLALRQAVRQDPDVILIGEMRDRETLEAAFQAAETGHLVFGTLHSSTVGQTIGRILDLFPPDRERQVRQSLRFNLRAIICQKILIGAKPDVGLVPALEILLANAAAQKALQEGEDQKLEAIVRSAREEGMVDFNTSLLELAEKGLITKATALEASHNPDQLKLNLKGIFLGDDRQILGGH